MHSITFECELITPLFMGNADPNDCELRAPSIKGALRFWWRAMNGHLVEKKDGKWDYDELQKKESEIFGSTGGRSKVIVRVIQEEKNSVERPKIEENNYLFYSLVNQNQSKKGIEKKEFKIIFQSLNEKNLMNAISSFWLLSIFGGLGARARRGAGAFAVKSILDKENKTEGLYFIPKVDEKIEEFLKRNIEAIISKNSISQNKNILCNTYSNLHNSSVCVSKKPEKKWSQSLGEIELLLSSTRTNSIDNKFTIFTLDQKAAFGLPINVRNDNQLNLVNHSRKASPIIISVTRFNKNLHWTLVYFKGLLIPPDDKILFESKNPKIGNAKKKFQKSSVNPKLINAFMEKVKEISIPIHIASGETPHA